MVSAPSAATASGTLLVVDEHEETARLIESHMRNAGHPVKAPWISDFEDLDEMLRRGVPDAVICSLTMPDMPLRAVVNLCRKLVPDLPVLAMAPALSIEEAVSAMNDGASDLVCCADARTIRHLELACIREILDHQQARDLRSTRARLSDFESRHLKLLEGTADAVVHIQEGILSHVNPAFAGLLGYEQADALIGVPVMDIVSATHQPKVKEHLKLLLKGKLDDQPLQCSLQCHNGEGIEVEARLTRGTVDGENFVEMLIRGRQPALSVVPEAAAPQPETPPALAVAVTQKAPDRIALFDALGAPGGASDAALVLLAPDAFSTLEERLGYFETELLMQQLGLFLETLLTSAQDGVYRFATDQFALVIRGVDEKRLLEWITQLRESTATQILTAGSHEAQITLSAVAQRLPEGVAVEAVLTQLVTALRELLSRGNNHCRVLGAGGGGNIDDADAARAAEISKALEDNRFKLAYQSIASLEGDTRQHFDVLARMIDASGRELHASEFIKTAEKFGLMAQLDRWVIMRALKVLNKREGSRGASILFVKISEDTLEEADTFLAWLLGLLKQRPLKNEEICFEIQELVLQNHIRKAKMLTKALREAGAGIAIEHFGAGNASAQMLDHVPATFIKFHRSFTTNFADKEVQRKMTTLIEVAKQRSIKTIVSHVEDANVMARMWQMGVNYIQGYHVQEPEVVLLSADPVRG
jgi:PAS domain S-box-containing protein